MVYNSTSCEEVIGRVIRKTRLTDITYADDIYEWLGEGLGRIMRRWKLKRFYQCLEIKDHMAKLPCGIQALNGVFYNGQRLRVGTGSIDARVQPLSSSKLTIGDASSSGDSQFYFASSTDPKLLANSQDLFYIRGTDILPMQTTKVQEFYQLELDYIKTSFKTGKIIIFFRKIDVDDKGYPLIPDLEEAKLALEWYVCGCLCMTGYKLPDPSMDYSFCEVRAEKFFRKAKNMISDPSEDELEAAKNLSVNLIPPDTYYETFFIGGEQRKFVVK